MRFAALAVLLSAAAAAGAQPGGAPMLTRQAQSLLEQEDALLRAVRAHDTAAVEAMVGDDFEMVVAPDAGRPVPRDEWIGALARPGAGSYAVEQLAVRDFGGVAVASFVLRGQGPRAKAPPVFVVDCWQSAGGGWKLARRLASLAAGSRREIPGDAVVETIRKKY